MSTPTSNSIPATFFSPSLAGEGRYVTDGSKWGGAFGTGVNLTYSFPQGTASFITGYSEFSAWYSLNSAERSAVQQALATWSAVANVTFTQVADNSSVVGDMRFAMADMSDFAHAYYPSFHPTAGDVWFGHNDWNSNGGGVSKGDYDYLTIIHEVGHALGLKHTFGSPNVIPAAKDSMFYSVMSYTASPWADDNYASFFPTGPMYLDLVAIQSIYGRNTAHNAGNNTYVYNDGTRYFQTIDDAGGSDTIAFNGTQSCKIDLRVSFYSSVSEAILFSNGHSSRSTVCIGPNSVIENASGGSGNDVLTGNGSANTLKGNAGNDTIYGGGGNDTILGSDGRDVLSGGVSNDQFKFMSVSHASTTSGAYDTITDFVHLADKIKLTDIDASTVLSDNNAFLFKAGGGFSTSNAGEIRYMQYNHPGSSNDYTMIFGDTDADTAAEFQIKLKGLISLTATDFYL